MPITGHNACHDFTNLTNSMIVVFSKHCVSVCMVVTTCMFICVFGISRKDKYKGSSNIDPKMDTLFVSRLIRTSPQTLMR